MKTDDEENIAMIEMINIINTGNEELVEEMMGKGRVLGGLTAQVIIIIIIMRSYDDDQMIIIVIIVIIAYLQKSS